MTREITSRCLSLAAFFLFALSPGQAQTSIIPQIADGGDWQTTLVLANTGASPASASLSFFQETSGGATESWNLPFLEAGSTQNLTLPAAGTLFLHTLGTASTTNVGWAQLQASSAVVAYAIFTLRVAGRQDQDGTAPAETAASRILVPFDNTAGFVSSIAIVNPTAASESIAVGIQTAAGAVSHPASLTLPAQGHTSFELFQQFSATTGQSGLLELYSATGSLSAIALRFNPTFAFTTAPVFPETGSPIIGPATTQVSSVTLSASSVASGGTVQGTVTLNAAAPSGGAAVLLSSSSTAAAVPSSVTVPAGATTANFTVTAGSLTSNQSVTISAQYGGNTVQTALSVTAAAAALPFANLVATVTFQPSGSASFVTVIELTPNAGSSSYSASLVGGATFLNGTASSQGQVFTFNDIQSSGLFLVPDISTWVVVATGSLSLTLSPTPAVSGVQQGNVTGTLTVAGNAFIGGTSVTLSGPISGTYTATLAG